MGRRQLFTSFVVVLFFLSSVISWQPAAAQGRRSGEARKPRLDAATPVRSEPEPGMTPVLRLELGAHAGRLTRMATDAAGRVVATASYDKTVRLWDSTTGKLLSILRPPIGPEVEGELYAVAFSPDGKTVACAGNTGAAFKERSIYLFDVQTGRLQKRLTGLTDYVLNLVYSRDGKYLAALQHTRHGLLLYRTSDYKLVGHYTECRERSFGMDFAPADGSGASRLVTVAFDGNIRLFEVASDSLKLIDQKKAPGGARPNNVRFSPDGTLIALCYSDVRRLDVVSAKDLSPLYAPDLTGVNNGIFHTVQWSWDGSTLYAAGNWRASEERITVRRWSERGKGPYQDVLFGPGGSRIYDIVPLADGSVMVGHHSGGVNAISARGEVRVITRSNKIGFGDNPLYVSRDGSIVQFALQRGGKSARLFDFANKGLRSIDAEARSKLTGPVTESPFIKMTNWKESHEPRINGQRMKIGAGETSYSYAITPDGLHVALGTNRYLRLCTKETEERWRVPVPDTAMSLTVSGDGAFVVAGLSDGTVNWYRLADGKLFVSLFVHGNGKQWVTWSPSGYYDCSEGADDLLGWHINNGRDREAFFYPLSRFSEAFYRPDVITGIIARHETDAQVFAYLRESVPGKPGAPPVQVAKPAPEEQAVPEEIMDLAKKLPPSVAILSPASGQTVEKEQILVQVAAEDMGGGVEEVWLFHNGKRVMEDATNTKIARQGKALQKTYAITLLEGENSLSATAFSKDRIEANPAEITITRKGESRTPDLWLVLVGIDKYKNPALNLSFAGPDIKSIRDFFTSAPVKKLFGAIHVYSVQDEKATKLGIKAVFDEIMQKAQQKDAILIYLAGHGDMVGTEWFFIPHDVTTPEVDEQVRSLAISAGQITELLKAFKAQKIFVIIDACKSGGMVSGMAGLRGLEDRKVMKQLVRSTGTYIMSATTDKQFAAEVKDLGHGAFTYTILEGLRAKPGEKVTVEGLIQYVKNRLPELTEKHRGSPQWPVSWGAGMDFPLAYY